jgi:hypothetical protein
MGIESDHFGRFHDGHLKANGRTGQSLLAKCQVMGVG